MSLPEHEAGSLAERLAALKGAIAAIVRKGRRFGVDPLAHPIRWSRGPLAVATPGDALLALDDPALARATVVVVTPCADALGALLDAADAAAGAPLPDEALRAAGVAAFEYQEGEAPDEPGPLLETVLDALVTWAEAAERGPSAG